MSGSIKDYTKYYKFYIPRFDLATWHDYIENNFRSIDAILNNIFSIANYKGEWKNSTTYTADDVLFIGNDETQYEGKLVKVLENHTTPGSGTFADYYTNNPNKYSVGLSATDAQIYAQNAQTSATNAQTYENLAKNWACKQSTTVDGTYYSAQYYAHEAYNRYLEAKAARDTALTYMTNAGNYATNASNYKDYAKDWATKTDGIVQNTDYSSKYYAQQAASSATNAYNYAQSVNPDNLVHIDGFESITGIKMFTNSVYINRDSPIFYIQYHNIEKGTQYDTNYSSEIVWLDKNNYTFGKIKYLYGSSKGSSIILQAWKSNAATDLNFTGLNISYYASDAKNITPSSDNDTNLGITSARWKQLYAGTSTISTSDERVKQQIDEIPEQVLLAWGEVNFYQFKYNDSVAEKGENARLHIGLIAQRIKTIFESHNLDATKYGLLCYDEWEAQEEEKDEEGNIITPAREAGNLYSLRYEECLCMEAAYQRYRADKLEQRLQNIENSLNINNQGEN